MGFSQEYQDEVKLWIDHGDWLELRNNAQKSQGEISREKLPNDNRTFQANFVTEAPLSTSHSPDKNLMRDFKSNTVGPETLKDEKKFNHIYFPKGY